MREASRGVILCHYWCLNNEEHRARSARFSTLLLAGKKNKVGVGFSA